MNLANKVVLVIVLALWSMISMAQTTIYVSTTGSETSPYANWTTAATNLGDAVAVSVAGDTVLVADGTYVLSNTVTVSKGITLVSVNGRDVAVIDNNGRNAVGVNIGHANAVFDGFTVKNGVYGGGRGVTLGNGRVQNCMIVSNNAAIAGGVYMTAGLVNDCVIAHNRSSGGEGPAGVYISGGVVSNCVISDQYKLHGCGAGVRMRGGVMTDCLIENNIGDGNNQAAGVWMTNSAVLKNSTLTGNRTTSLGGNILLTGANALVTNCVIMLGSAASMRGGGVLIRYGGTVSDCRIANNSRYGVAFYGTAGLVKNCLIEDNGDGGVCGYNASVCGTVENCIIRGNEGKYSGGIYAQGNGLMIRNCRILDNRVTGYYTIQGGGGVFCKGVGPVTVQNCLIAGNSSAKYGGGVYATNGFVFQNCTIADNTASYGGGVYKEGAVFANCIIYHNTATTSGSNVYQSTTFYTNCCIAPVNVAHTGTFADDPLFVNMTADDFRLGEGSPCINAGQIQAWMAGAKDLAGNTRVYGASVDVGAYEYGPLVCSFVGDPLYGESPLDVVFTAAVAGVNIASLYHKWDFVTSGVFNAGSALATNTYQPGIYSVALTVSNGVGETAGWTNLDYVHVGPLTFYVATNALGVWPYTNWVTAASNIYDALDVAFNNQKILVSDGTYTVYDQINVQKGVLIKSVNGPKNTILSKYPGNTSRLLLFSHSNAVFDGFTIAGASNSGGNGMGAYVRWGSTLKNSIVTENFGNDGGAVYVVTGTVQNCSIYMNHGQNMGGGVYVHSGGLLENSTIVNNEALVSGGGVYCADDALLRNTIVYGNTSADAASNWFHAGAAVFYTNCCVAPCDTVSGSGNIGLNPVFVDTGADDYRLSRESPCINIGTNQDWMMNSLDVLWQPRILDGIVDIGAYEYRHSGTVISCY